ncbi:MAG: hypothetical protein V1800_15380 [Candidatus Latescibacterota bacterium]
MCKKCSLALMALMGVLLLTSGCDITKPEVPKYEAVPLSVEMVGGPTTGAGVVPFGSVVAFKWKAVGGEGSYTFSYQLDGGSFSTWRPTTSVSYANQTDLTPGDHTFKVKVMTEVNTETAPVQRAFKIGAQGAGDTLPPTLVITSPGVGYKTAVGSKVVVNWKADDQSNSIAVEAGISLIATALNDTTIWTLRAHAPSSLALTLGKARVHTVYVKAVDNAGNATVATLDIEAKEPTILYVDEEVTEAGYSGETAALAPSGEFSHDEFYKKNVLAGFAYEEWDIQEKGYPTMATVPASITTILWVGSGDVQNSSWGWNEGWAYTYSAYEMASDTTGLVTIVSVFLSEWVDAGKKLWIVSESFLEEIDIGFGGGIFPNGFEDVYMHLAADSSYVGVSALDIEPSANVTEAQYPSMFVDNGKWGGEIGDHADWDVDAMPFIDADAEAVYETPDGDVVGIRSPIGGTGTQFVFMSFPLYYFSSSGAATLGKQVLGVEFGN